MYDLLLGCFKSDKTGNFDDRGSHWFRLPIVTADESIKIWSLENIATILCLQMRKILALLIIQHFKFIIIS